MSKAVPSYRKHKNGQAFVRCSRINGGKNLYLGVYGSSESFERYREVLKQLELASKSPGMKAVMARSTGRGTIGAAVDRYLEFAKNRYSDADGQTKEYGEMASALSPVLQLFGSLPSDEFTPLHLVAVQEYLLELDTLCRQTINHRVVRIRRMFRWASKFGQVPEDLYWRLKCVDPIPFGRGFEADEVEPVDWHVVAETLPWLTPTVSAMVRAQLFCGMRPQDACRMRPMDIDQSDAECWIYQPPKHKLTHLNKKRFIAVPRFAQVVIEPFLDRPRDACLFSPRESYRQYRQQRALQNRSNRKTKVYPSEIRARARRHSKAYDEPGQKIKRTGFDTDSYRQAIVSGLERAAAAGVTIPHWHPHRLRHTMSTSISQLLGEQEAQRWLGHERLETTGIYTQRQVRELRAIARKLSSTLMGESASIMTALLAVPPASYAAMNRTAS